MKFEIGKIVKWDNSIGEIVDTDPGCNYKYAVEILKHTCNKQYGIKFRRIGGIFWAKEDQLEELNFKDIIQATISDYENKI